MARETVRGLSQGRSDTGFTVGYFPVIQPNV